MNGAFGTFHNNPFFKDANLSTSDLFRLQEHSQSAQYLQTFYNPSNQTIDYNIIQERLKRMDIPVIPEEQAVLVQVKRNIQREFWRYNIQTGENTREDHFMTVHPLVNQAPINSGWSNKPGDIACWREGFDNLPYRFRRTAGIVGCPSSRNFMPGSYLPSNFSYYHGGTSKGHAYTSLRPLQLYNRNTKSPYFDSSFS